MQILMIYQTEACEMHYASISFILNININILEIINTNNYYRIHKNQFMNVCMNFRYTFRQF